MSEVKYKLAAGTNVGLIRKNNEDNFVVCPDISSSDWRIPQASDYADLGAFGALLVVADGMGGANAGEVASAIAVETVQQSFQADKLQDVIADDKAIQEFMKEVVKAADLNIFKRGRNDSDTRGMGTTIVMAWILNSRAYICWCGDSRCYLLNREKGLVRLSKDHSYVQELIDRGELEPEYAMDHPLSNVITRCLGDTNNRAIPDTRVCQLHDGDTLLLCSDGLSGLCSDPQILDLLITFREDPEECKNELISAALNEGGHDNVTVALCNIQMEEELPLKEGENKSPSAGTKEIEVLSETLPTNHVRKKKSQLPWLLLFVLILGIGAFFVTKKVLPQKDFNKTSKDPIESTPTDSLAAPMIIEDDEKDNPKENLDATSRTTDTIGKEEERTSVVSTNIEDTESIDSMSNNEQHSVPPTTIIENDNH